MPRRRLSNKQLLASLLDTPVSNASSRKQKSHNSPPIAEREFQSRILQRLQEIPKGMRAERDAWRAIKQKAKHIPRTSGALNRIDLGLSVLDDIADTRTASAIKKPLRAAKTQWDKLPRKVKIGLGVGGTLYVLGKTAQAVDKLFAYAPRKKETPLIPRSNKYND